MRRKLLMLLNGSIVWIVRIALGGFALALLLWPVNAHVGTIFTQTGVITFRSAFLGILLLVASMSWKGTHVAHPHLAAVGVWLMVFGGATTALLTLIDVTVQLPRVMLVVDSLLVMAVLFVLFQVSRTFRVKEEGHDHEEEAAAHAQEVLEAHDGQVPEKG